MGAGECAMPASAARSLMRRDLLVVVPHSGVVIPAEIRRDRLSERFGEMLRNVDWYTNWLYDFRDILDNQQMTFPYCSLLLEANRHPEILDDCVPLKDVCGEPLYRPGQEPSTELRLLLAHKYLVAFHRKIEAAIGSGMEFLLDGHSTVPARGVAENQIDLMNFQHSHLDDGPKFYSPLAYVETYAEEIQKRLPDVAVTVNSSEYYTVYGHVCAEHSVNSFGRVGRRVPAIIQETCENLYKNPDNSLNVDALNRLRCAFAESLHEAIRKVRRMKRATKMIDLHNMRQTYDFDCGVKALQAVMVYYGVEERADALYEALDADDRHGTSVGKMIEVAESRGFQVVAGQNWTLEDVKLYVSQDHPVIVLIQAWADGYKTIEDWRKNYDDGHYAIVTGYNNNIVFFEDPASFHRTWLKENEFLARWHDKDPETGEKLTRFGMVLLGREAVGRVTEHMG